MGEVQLLFVNKLGQMSSIGCRLTFLTDNKKTQRSKVNFTLPHNVWDGCLRLIPQG